MSAVSLLRARVDEQRRWIREHGDTLGGYMEHYEGRCDGMTGEAFRDYVRSVYMSDRSALRLYEGQVERAERLLARRFRGARA